MPGLCHTAQKHTMTILTRVRCVAVHQEYDAALPLSLVLSSKNPVPAAMQPRAHLFLFRAVPVGAALRGARGAPLVCWGVTGRATAAQAPSSPTAK